MNVLPIIAASKSSGGLLSYAFLPLILFAMYFLMIRPQRRRQRQTASVQQSIEVGDEVMTTSGMYGFVTGFEGDVAWLEIDDDVQIRVARAAIQRRVDTAKSDADGTSGSGDAKPRHTKMTDVVVSADPIDDEPKK